MTKPIEVTLTLNHLRCIIEEYADAARVERLGVLVTNDQHLLKVIERAAKVHKEPYTRES